MRFAWVSVVNSGRSSMQGRNHGRPTDHADQRELLSFITRMLHWLTQVRLVHGEASAKEHLREKLIEV
ncbi:MBL fold metallo-hydrolase RNA specificity domain-containing protein [Stutzerimonas stutzeri]|uniref:MBL fold metallo-hydrolase RNA specificity domain-containing protein n=2 Tax=Stutzerimonas stutzeri TaxID=316 RepID=UPI000DAC196F|nr:hypothetical protein DOT40_04050 [Stutzerimonas stutzeri]HAJ89025.1 hypothetical protein [Pseudomonas sp.]RRV51845.1 hypothetical protein EGJ26_06420 [Stutzerimonas stutzeri]RRV56620.1 hypothetical protein EGJ19_01610 [Stutzerimonas stutzeri]RRW22531.1 hypothetical protein EGJ45_00485 [Stutzerimonas stutzeri]